MDTKKFEYLETIREAIEMGDYEELDEYVEDIRDHVKSDPDFAELFVEIKSKNYNDAISLIEEFIYADIESEFGDSFDETASDHLNGTEMEKKKGIVMEMEEELPEEISFEEFNDEDFTPGTGFEDE
jgi:hypothetical protein